jgi:hypothetical protein
MNLRVVHLVGLSTLAAAVVLSGASSMQAQRRAAR